MDLFISFSVVVTCIVSSMPSSISLDDTRRCSSQATRPTPNTVSIIPPYVGGFRISPRANLPKKALMNGFSESTTITCFAPSKRRASSHRTSPTTIPSVELSIKKPTAVTVNTSNGSISSPVLLSTDCENPLTAAIMTNQMDATLHLYMLSANAEPLDDVHLTSQMKNPIDMKNGAKRAAITPSAVELNTVAVIVTKTARCDE
mmetsp:Transcript_2076/g.4590  ORF Transcript_2076/g.4590 Transcript_2076/m.4590 type:complete len:203 (+) Transcript_2076:2815-3423(+)